MTPGTKPASVAKHFDACTRACDAPAPTPDPDLTPALAASIERAKLHCWMCDAQPAPYVMPDGGHVCLACAKSTYADTRDTREHRREAGVRFSVWSDPRAGR